MSDTLTRKNELPDNYRKPVELFKKLMISTFSICAFLLLCFMVYYVELNINLESRIKSIGNIIYNPFPIVIICVATVPLILSSINISITNVFSKLSRQCKNVIK